MTYPGDQGSNQDSLEPIAIIGLSIKFPQEATSAEDFWKMLVCGRSALTEVPPDRFNIDAFYHEDPNRLDTVWKHHLTVEGDVQRSRSDSIYDRLMLVEVTS